MGDVAGYVVADYLLEYGTWTRRTAVPPESFWTAHLMAGVAPRDQVRLGEEAAHRALLAHAEPLYQSAANAGDAMGWVRLAELQEWRGRPEEAEALWRRAIVAGYQDGWEHLAARLSRQKRTDDEIEPVPGGGGCRYTRSCAGILPGSLASAGDARMKPSGCWKRKSPPETWTPGSALPNYLSASGGRQTPSASGGRRSPTESRTPEAAWPAF